MHFQSELKSICTLIYATIRFACIKIFKFDKKLWCIKTTSWIFCKSKTEKLLPTLYGIKITKRIKKKRVLHWKTMQFLSINLVWILNEFKGNRYLKNIEINVLWKLITIRAVSTNNFNCWICDKLQFYSTINAICKLHSATTCGCTYVYSGCNQWSHPKFLTTDSL